MTEEYKELTPTLVMRRFFAALKAENLMAAELLATHENFDGGDADYSKAFGKMLENHSLSMPTFEWLLTFAKGASRGFWRPTGESTGYTRRSGNNWRGHVCDRVRKWMREPTNMTDEQRRIARLTYDLGWLQPGFELLDSELGRDWLKEIVAPDRLLEMALTKRTGWDGGKHVVQPICTSMIEWLLAKGSVDLSRCGDELVREYQSDGHILALRLIKSRDPDKKMPKEFTDMIQDVVLKYKLYQKLQRDLPILLGAKTHEIDP